MPWEQVYTRALYTDMARKKCTTGKDPLSHQSIRHVLFWKNFAGDDLRGRPIQLPDSNPSLHMDVVGVGHGAKLHLTDYRPA